MRKLAYLLCAAMLLGLLAGCQAEPVDTLPSGDTIPTGTTAQPTMELTEPTESTEPAEPVAVIPPVPPENPGNSLIAYDPDRELYIANENIYMDYYLGVTAVPPIIVEIYAKEYIDPDMVGVDFPEGSPFRYSVWSENVTRDTTYVADREPESWYAMPYHVYYAYRGEDPAAFDSNTQCMLEFQALKSEDIPEFYRVAVRLYPEAGLIDQPVTLEKVDITVDGKVYETKLGRIRVFPGEELPTDAQETVIGKEQSTDTVTLYNDGIIPLTVYIPQHRVSEDITLTGLRMADEDSEVLSVSVIESSAEGEMVTKWDGKTPLQLKKGQWIHFWVIIRNDFSENLLSRLYLQSLLEYTKDGSGETVCIATAHWCYPPTNPHENYAIIFDGVDMEPYYRDYFYKHNFQVINEYRDK